MKLTSRLIVLLLALAVLPVLLLGWLGLSQSRDAMENERVDTLDAIANLRVERIEETFGERKADIITMQSSWNIHQNLPILHRYLGTPDAPEFRRAKAALDSQLQNVRKVYEYDNVLLLDRDGRLAYATDENMQGQKLGQPLTGFGDLFAAAAKGLYISPVFSGYVKDDNPLHFFMAVSVKGGSGRLIGVLALLVDMNTLYSHLTDVRGLGKTGEVLIGMRAGDVIQFISPTRFDHGGFLKIPWDAVQAQPMRRALQGRAGNGEGIDYRGENVVAVWKPLPELGWGVVTKIDDAEIFAPIDRLQRLGLLVVSIVGLLSVCFALITARSVIRPIERMQQASEMIAAGNLEYRVGIEEKSEIGELSRSLDEMADRLKRARGEQGRLVTILNSTPDLVGMADADGTIRYLNPAGRNMLGLDDAVDLSTMNISQVHPPWARQLVLEEGIPSVALDGIWEHETALLTRDGREIPVSQVVLAHKDAGGKLEYLSTIMRDLSRVRRLESETEKSRQSLILINRDLEQQVRKNNEVTRQLERKLAEEDETRRAMLLMLEDLNASKTEIEHGKRQWESTFDAVTQPVFLHDGEGRVLRANRAYAEKAGQELEMLAGQYFWQCFPKEKQRPEYCVEGVSNHQPQETEIELGNSDAYYRIFMYPVYDVSDDYLFSVHFMEDITERRKTTQALEASRQQLQTSLEGTILAVSHAVEARDPYTAGHQQRVAQLAQAMAEHLGLDGERVRGIYFGALIHDLGKIHIPAEILSKPARLSEHEYLIIKEHPDVGYDILKEIEFPWPVVDIIHQHHERLDGSGYPQGLKGNEICLEARVVAVADVLEAMSSHRPYRPGLGSQAAFDELRKNRGTFYDPEAVDACIAVFNSGFRFGQ